MTDDAADVLYQTDLMDPDRARALQATLGQVPDAKAGEEMPTFFHQIYFWNALPPQQLGRDGHPARGQGVIPDLGLPRRMWAGGRMTFHAPLRLGRPAECRTELVSAKEKTGRSGALGLVTIRLTYGQDGIDCITDERDLIYREDPDPDAPKPSYPQAPDSAESRRGLSFDTTVLFRYSALTFNGHRIHYDLDYATEVEGYSGLVVHGPLLAQHLIIMARDELGPLKSFTFRATAPLMHFESATACRNGTRLWVRGPDGRLCINAEATV
jgi:3-methylfumaryl-CoA hydratase